ncbi:MAG: TlpA disulfide reductase family protein [bacterium]
MKTRIAGRVGMLAALVTVSIAAPRTSFAQDMGIKVGAAAPGAAVESLEGKAMDLGAMYGTEPVVLEFWATWCPLCKKLEPAMQAAREKYAGKVQFVSVGVPSNQSAEKQKAYVTKQQIGGQFVFDKDGAAMKAFAVPHTSYVVVVDKGGKVVYTGVGPEQDIDAAVRKALPN